MRHEQDTLELGRRVADGMVWENRIPILIRSTYIKGLARAATDKRYQEARSRLMQVKW